MSSSGAASCPGVRIRGWGGWCKVSLNPEQQEAPTQHYNKHMEGTYREGGEYWYFVQKASLFFRFRKIMNITENFQNTENSRKEKKIKSICPAKSLWVESFFYSNIHILCLKITKLRSYGWYNFYIISNQVLSYPIYFSLSKFLSHISPWLYYSIMQLCYM